MLLVIWFVVLSWLSGYRDMARFFYKKTWSLDRKANWLPYWTVAHSSNKMDPFHVAGGTMWALIILLIFFEAIYHYLTHDLFIIQPMFVLGGEWYWFLLTLAIHGAAFWLFFYWIRNILMHIAGVRWEYREWSYIWPPVLLWIWKKVKSKK